MQDEIKKISDYVRAKINGEKPEFVIILGSGLGGIGDDIEDAIYIPYNEIEGFPMSTVQGHKGQLIFGKLAGKNVLCMQGRLHYYEGHHPSKISLVIHAFKDLGADKVILTNASGSLRSECPPGSLVLITDHINFSFQSPLVGPNDDNLGPRFVDMTEAYSKDLREKMHAAAKSENINLDEGVYIMTLGPTFETPSEIKAFKLLGADLVGMSTVPETIAAIHAGMDVVGVATVTNLAAGLHATKLSHKETVEQAVLAGAKLQRLITTFIKDF